MGIFQEHYLAHERPYELVSYVHSSGADDRLALRLLVDAEEQEVEGVGNGPIAALVDAFGRSCGITIRIRDYHEHAMSADTNATAAAYPSTRGDVLRLLAVLEAMVGRLDDARAHAVESVRLFDEMGFPNAANLARGDKSWVERLGDDLLRGGTGSAHGRHLARAQPADRTC
jgi:hypothetical protein